ncbi:hypothetical protein BJI48_09120 [Helicobacter sp. 11S02596-1]|nr:hypothetical protein BJI48_09120 [Helicobacter sp. 11S02596-1]
MHVINPIFRGRVGECVALMQKYCKNVTHPNKILQSMLLSGLSKDLEAICWREAVNWDRNESAKNI